jgi:hypothetical protein
MASNFWKNLGVGDTYDKINGALGGLPDLISGKAGPQQNFGLAGQAGMAGMISQIPGAAAIAPVAGAAMGALAPLAGAAYGIGKLVAPKVTDQVVQNIKDWAGKTLNRTSAIGSGWATGMGESIPGSKFAESLLPDQSKGTLEQIKQQSPGATSFGRVAGTIGQMALPGANVIKGAGALGAIGNAAINALPYAVGSGLDVGATTGDVGKGLLAGGLSEAAGTALPAIAQIPAVQRVLGKMQLAAAGIRQGFIRKVLMSRAKSIGLTGGAVDTFVNQHADDLMTNAANMLQQAGSGRAGKEAIKAASSEGFQTYGQLWDQAVGKLDSGDIAHIMSTDQDIQPLIASFGREQVEKRLQDMASTVESRGWANGRNDLSNISMSGNRYAQKQAQKMGNPMAWKDDRILDAGVADALHDHIDGQAHILGDWARGKQLNPETGQMEALPGGPVFGPEMAKKMAGIQDLSQLKATYPAVLAINKARASEETGIPGLFASGSDTAMRMLMGGNPTERLIGIAGAAGTAPGVIGDIASGNTDQLPEDLAKMVGASFGGRLLNLGMSKVGEQATGALAGGLRTGSINPALSRMIAGAASAAQPSPTAGMDQNAQPNAEAPVQTPTESAGPVPDQIPLVSPDLMQGASQLGQLDTTSAPSLPPPPKLPAEHAEGITQATLKEQTLEPEQVSAAKEAVGGAFEDRIKAKILADWQNWQNPYKSDFETFFEQARQSTNNFDPKSVNTAKIIAGPNYKDYLKSYNVALNLQSLGKDLSEAIGYWGMPALLGGAEAKSKNDQLVNTLYTAMTGDMKDPDKATRKTIENRLATLRQQHLQPSKQRDELFKMLEDEYGVRFDMLKQYGLIK